MCFCLFDCLFVFTNLSFVIYDRKYSDLLFLQINAFCVDQSEASDKWDFRRAQGGEGVRIKGDGGAQMYCRFF